LADNILVAIQERIRREMNEVADVVATGGCLSGESADMIAIEYAGQAGVIKGLAMAERCILDVLDDIDEREKLDI
jgi:hypothetical protein